MLGEVIHGYRIDRVLSEQGGFGDVYLATHVESGAEAVVKVLKPEMSALRDVVARFFNEARAAASIHHPGIVQIHNVGYHGDRAYLLMERLRGEDLETRLRRGPLALDRAIVFLRQTAGAIGAAHERGIVHRDLKPANLFIVEDPDVVGGERVKVLDFGIAKLTADTGAGRTQGVFGTPAYMSPEQCASTGAVDARADLYSLGCIFYELGCGRPPFGHGGLELIAAHLRDTPPPPRAIAPALPPAIEQVILQLLDKQPERRIPSCAALVAALDAAALSSGARAASQPAPWLAGTASQPPMRSAELLTPNGSSPTTLGLGASAVSTVPAKRRLGMWLGASAALVVGGIALVVVLAGRSSDADERGDHRDNGTRVGSHADGGVEVVRDAAVVAEATPDAMQSASTQDAGPITGAPTREGATPPVPLEPGPNTTPAAGAERTKSQVATQRAVDAKLSDAQIAARLNEDGKAAMLRGDHEGASKMFEEAAARHPEAKYLINLCTARFQSGRFGDALTACLQGTRHEPTAEQRQRVERLLERIRAEAKAQHVELRE
jgi:eukaryotic-like serine/threonine-protein kinase